MVTGTQYDFLLQFFGYKFSYDHRWINIGVLVAMLVALRIFIYVGLIRLGRK